MIEKRLPLILLMLFALCYFFASYIPETGKSFFYAISLSIQEILLFVLPFIIFSFLFEGLVSLRSTAFKFIILIIPAIFFSGFIALQFSYFLGKYLFLENMTIAPLVSSGIELAPLWSFGLPKIVSINITLGLGLFFGIFMPVINPELSLNVSKKLTKISLLFLHKIFMPLIPLFIFGFLLRIAHDGHLDTIIKDYFWILLYVVAFTFSYITFLYFIACGFNVKKVMYSVKNMLPALLTGFSTMSSAMAMPFLIQGVEKNVSNPSIGRAVVPISINPHLIGDAVSISLLSFAVLISFGHGFPAFETYFFVSLRLLMAKLGAVGIPGGGILVLCPILKEYLGFDATMVSLITAIYILFDPFITVGNIYGNGAFAMLFSKLFEERKIS